MAVTQQDLNDVRNQVSDLRVLVANLTGALGVTNQRMNDLISNLEKRNGDHKWVIGTFVASASAAASFIAIAITVVFHLS